MPIEEVVEKCHRGDWLLWLARNVNIDFQKLTLAKGYCAQTILHLMKDERSIKAVKAAINFGNGLINEQQLKDAAAAATYTYAAYAAYAYTAAKIKNQQLTADICRRYIGKDIIEKVNFLLKQKNYV